VSGRTNHRKGVTNNVACKFGARQGSSLNLVREDIWSSVDDLRDRAVISRFGI
jgi:hypothetical protein